MMFDKSLKFVVVIAAFPIGGCSVRTETQLDFLVDRKPREVSRC